MKGKNDPWQGLWDEAHTMGRKQGMFIGFWWGTIVMSIAMSLACGWREISSTALRWRGSSQ